MSHGTSADNRQVLERPDLDDAVLIEALGQQYGLRAGEIAFLPLGADWSTAVFRVAAEDGGAYFLKLRSGPFEGASVAVPRLLSDRGVAQVIPPLQTRSGALWTRVNGDRFALSLYPFVEGQDGYTRALSDSQWRQLGEALRGIHATHLPERLAARIPRDTFAPVWRDRLRGYLERAEHDRFGEPVAAELAALLWSERDQLWELVRRTEELAEALRASSPPATLCHGDVHAGNALVGDGDALHVVDWDTLVFAPPERDLALIGATWGGAREAEHFYTGYGRLEPGEPERPDVPDGRALSYYRYHRTVEDFVVDCETILDSEEGGASRAEMVRMLKHQLHPGGFLDAARRLDERQLDVGEG